MSLTPRLLGLAFASADALVEVDGDGRVSLALGAGPVPDQPLEGWTGAPLADRLGMASAMAVHDRLTALTPGRRSDPLDILIDCGGGRMRRAVLRAFVLPDTAPAISCAIVYQGEAFDPPRRLPTEGPAALPDADAFLAAARQSLPGQDARALKDLALAFVEVKGLEQLDPAQSDDIEGRIAALLTQAAHDGRSVGRLTAERYAVIRPAQARGDLATEVRNAGAAAGVDLETRGGQSALGDDPASALRAMRFAIEACLKDGGLEAPERAFADSLEKTLRDADRFRSIVRGRDFDLHYQPIVELKSRVIHHFEALTRFAPSVGPGSAIRMAEELALIEDFDLVVAEKAVKRLRIGDDRLHIAVNVSGASLASDAYVAGLLRMTADTPGARRRLMIEVTETAALADLAAADRRLRTLREAGLRVCIDDFGAGSASFDYLRGLSVDAVKIDGALVQDVETNPRTRTLIGHLVDLCTALDLDTIAEMIETEAAADALAGLGVRQGQGWLFGKAEPEPRLPVPGFDIRRQGAVKSRS